MKFSLPVPVKKMLMNKNTLYVVFGLSLLQWLYLLAINRFDLIIVFGLISFVIYKFNRNMIYVLGVPFLIVLMATSLREGFEGESDSSSKEKKEKTDGDTQIISPTENNTNSDSNDTSTEKEPEAHNESDTKESAENNEEKEPEFQSNQINYASTLTENMKSYNELLGSDGFAKMSQDTQMLLKQQEQLGNAMKQFAPLIGQMTPFLEKASGLLNNMDMKQINKVANVFKNQ
jgi:hypothetical protein